MVTVQSDAPETWKVVLKRSPHESPRVTVTVQEPSPPGFSPGPPGVPPPLLSWSSTAV